VAGDKLRIDLHSPLPDAAVIDFTAALQTWGGLAREPAGGWVTAPPADSMCRHPAAVDANTFLPAPLPSTPLLAGVIRTFETFLLQLAYSWHTVLHSLADLQTRW